MATVSAPATPPRQHPPRNRPPRASPLTSVAKPAPPDCGSAADSTTSTTSPEPNEIAAASESVVEADAQLAVDPRLNGGQHPDEPGAAEDEPGGQAGAVVGAGHHEPTTGLEPVTP